MKNRKNVLRWLVFLSMLCTLVMGYGAVNSYADELMQDDDGNYHINSIDDFVYTFTENVNNGESYKGKTVYLDCDIFYDNYEWGTRFYQQVYEPIGRYGFFFNDYFEGTFDGQGHTVRAYIDGKTPDAGSIGYIGVFGCIKNATIKNLNFVGKMETENSKSHNAAIGGICGYAKGTCNITNCTVGFDDVRYTTQGISYDYAIGGILGYSEDCTIENCTNYSNIKILRGDGYAGGIAGKARIIRNCKNYGNVTGEGGIVGACFGYDAEITNCVNYGNVTRTDIADRYVGGIIGDCDKKLTISNCYNFGNVTADKNSNIAGGICGKLNKNSSLSYCGNTGKITAAIGGGLAGYCTSVGNVFDTCYNQGDFDTNMAFGLAMFGTFSHCYNMGGATMGYPISYKGCPATNTYYSKDNITSATGTGTPTGTGLDLKYFKGGEVCYDLNYYKSDGDLKYYQTIGEDAGPVHSSDHKIVYYDSSKNSCYNTGNYSLSIDSENKTLYDSGDTLSYTVKVDGIATEDLSNIPVNAVVTIEGSMDPDHSITDFLQITDQETKTPIELTRDGDKVSFKMPHYNTHIRIRYIHKTWIIDFLYKDSTYGVAIDEFKNNYYVELQLNVIYKIMEIQGVWHQYDASKLSFDHWEDENGNTVTDEYIKSRNYEYGERYTYYAVLSDKSVTVHFLDENGNAYSDTAYADQSGKNVLTINFPTPPEKEDGSKILGWRIGENGPLIERDGSNLNLMVGDINLYAAYAKPYNVYLAISKDSSGTLGSDYILSTQNVIHNSELKFPDATDMETLAEKIKNELGTTIIVHGWTRADGTSVDLNDLIDASDFNEDTTIYLDFDIAPITVNFLDKDGNTLSGDVYKSQTVNSADDLILPDVPDAEDYSGYVTGWSTSIGGDLLTGIDVEGFSGTVNLYARYIAPNIDEAQRYTDYEINPEYTDTDAIGFTQSIAVDDSVVISKIKWWFSENENDFQYQGEADEVPEPEWDDVNKKKIYHVGTVITGFEESDTNKIDAGTSYETE